MSKHKARLARLDAEGTAQSLTRIVAYTLAGKLNLPHNVQDYEIRDT